MSAIDVVVVDVGVTVVWGVSLTNVAVSAYDPKYAPEPLNDAMIVYLPGTSGVVQSRLKSPLESLVASPMWMKLLLGSTASIDTGTPVACGIANCPYTYFIHSPTLASETAGTPCGNLRVIDVCFVPGDTSVTVPWIIIVSPPATLVSGA